MEAWEPCFITKESILNVCFDELNLTNPDTVKEVQQEYIQSGVAIAQEILGIIKDMVEGIQISPPLGKYELALEVLKVL